MKKIEYAVGAAGVFIYHLHQEGLDRGMIASFGNSYRAEQSFTSREADLHRALGSSRLSLSTIRANNEGTRLYASIEDCICEFWNERYGARRNVPWLLTVITDGQDNADSKYRYRPDLIGSYVATYYNQEPSNFIIVIGVGKGNEIDRTALGRMGDCGGFAAMSIEAFPLLELAFLQIAIQVSTEISGIEYRSGRMSWQQVAEIRRTSRVPIDYAFLIDRSGSMADEG